MAPRRKRNVLEDSDSEEEKAHEQRKTNLRNFFSPISKADARASAPGPALDTAPTTPTASPTPNRRTRTPSSSAKKPTRGGKTVDSLGASPSTSSPRKPNSTNGSTANGGSNGKSPCPSPDKRRGSRSQKGQAEEKSKSADLVALFTKQAEKAQNSPPKKATSLALGIDIASDPIISDDDIADDEIADSSAVTASYVGSRAQKRWKSASSATTLSSTAMPPPLLPPTSQRFKRPMRTIMSNGGTVGNDDDLRPWSERFAPNNLDELAVHKKKVADVRRWLEDVMQGRLRQRLLVLKGAAGTGKTTTVRLLAKDMSLDILEWRNPTGASSAGASSLGFASAAVQFDEFLNRSARFSQLDLDDTSSDSDDASTRRVNGKTEPPAPNSQRRKIVVIEEFPNTFMRSSSALTGFRSSVLQFLAANTPSMTAYAQRRASFDPMTISPVIMIVSETLLTTTSASADSFTAHRLLGPEILRHPGTGLIEFNAIAPSLLAKALELIVQKEARKSGRRRTPGPLVLRRLGEVGDIRSAVASLEFLCLKGDDDGDWGAKVAFTKGRKGPKDAALTKGERQTLEMVSQREASLGVFHAVGKVVYNKRDDLPPPPDSEEARAEMLPDYLAHYARPKPSLVAVDTLIDETGTDTNTFISALHENYVLSCEQTGPTDPMSSIDYINGCIEYLSESDLLCPGWDIFFGGRGTNRFNFGRDSGSHVLRQDEMAFQVAVRGLLFSLPSPVKRSSTNQYQRGGSGGESSGGSSTFRMFYPMSIKLWRNKEELEALLDVWSSKLLRGEVAPSSGGALLPTQPNASQRVISFRRPSRFSSSQAPGQSQQQPMPPPPRGNGTSDDAARKGLIRQEDTDDGGGYDKTADGNEDAAPPLLLSLGSSARKEMVLERLPYMALIARGRRCSFGSMGMRDLEKMVSFHGIGAAVAGADDADEDAADASIGIGPGTTGLAPGDAWATDKPTDDGSPRKPRRGPVRPAAAAAAASSANDADDMDGLSTGLPMYKLVLSDDDIEDVD